MNKIKLRNKRKTRIRSRISGTAKVPRMAVYKSNKYIYAQIINDEKHVTLAAAKGINAAEVGEKIAKAAKLKKIKKIIFDRGGYKYHGKIKALADAARKAGLNF